MKNNLFLFFLAIVSLSFHSCSNEEKELQLIIEAYEQQITEDMELDLEMKFEYSIIVDTITHEDSFSYYLNQYCEVFNHEVHFSSNCLELGIDVLIYEDSLQNMVDEMMVTGEKMKEIIKSGYLDYSREREAKEVVDLVNAWYNVLEENRYLFEKINEMDGLGSAEVGYVIESKYEINNPLLDTKQTLTKQHLFSTDLSSIIKSM